MDGGLTRLESEEILDYHDQNFKPYYSRNISALFGHTKIARQIETARLGKINY